MLVLPALILARPATPQGADEGPDRYVVRTIEGRWLHEDQVDRPSLSHAWTEVIELRERYRSRSGDQRLVDVRLGSTDATEHLDSLGRLGDLDVKLPPLRYSQRAPEGWIERGRVMRLRSNRGVLILPSSRFRDLRIALPRRDMAVGDRWSDTLAFVAAPGDGLRESYREVRDLTVLADTVVDGRRAYALRVDGAVEYDLDDVTYHGPDRVRIDRRAAGRTGGRVVVDATTGLRMAGTDTASWSGQAILHDPVAGPLTSGVDYGRIRTWRHFDPETYAVYRDSLREARIRGGGGMIASPQTPLDRRLRAGDLALADSLIPLWIEAPTPDSAAALGRSLGWIRGRGPWTTERWDSVTWAVQMERGDTAQLVQLARNRRGPATPGLERSRFLALFLDAPERLWRLGAPVRDDYVDLADALVRSAALVTPDSTSRPCRAAECEFWLDQYETATDPRLRDAALAGLFARAPARWYPVLAERAAAGSTVVAAAMRLAEGRPTEDHPEIPGAGASWQDWRTWWGPFGNSMGGMDPIAALRIHQAVTGSDPLAGWSDAWPPAEDSARIVMGPILRAAGRLPEPTAAEVRRGLLAGEPPGLGHPGGLPAHVRDRGVPMDDADATRILAPLIRSFVDEEPGLPWPKLRPDEDRPARRPGSGRGAEEDPLPVFVVEGELPDAVLEGLPPGVERISGEAWALRDPRAGGHALFTGRPLRWGPFVRVGWSWTLYMRRAPDVPPRGYANGGTIVLMETPEGWRIVSQSSWIT